ncbi:MULTISPECIES: hypothetical protein [unclassified Streptomyces]|nr:MULTISPECIES: hypothetical protein [unclassified Streptomyces]MCX5048838.1 hypothetical protein [Streptomyces sp. NBC_00474]MCX5056421.1 hypothetical protein [Streptomyces sp. NBC_00452]MCX5246658.1 hypothetical protein [Streptomyces sp. NBC_00201]MCX5287523.1 hypothetical protein [Streptomyces sp. NBC_00183]
MRAYATVANPVIPGFRPDPGDRRVGGDHHIVCSSFEWTPPVP